MSELIRVLMYRDQLTLKEAQEMIEDMRQRVLEGEDPEDVLLEESLEPDYALDIIP